MARVLERDGRLVIGEGVRDLIVCGAHGRAATDKL